MVEAEGILTYRKKIPRNGSKRVARILVFKIRPSQEILKIRDGTPLEKKRVARILVFKIRPSQEILKIRDDVPSNVVQKKRVARILVFKIRPSQEILKIRDGTPLEAEGILTYRKKIPRNGSVWNFSNKLDVPSNVVQKKSVARILVFKIRPSQEILKIRDGTSLEKILKIRDGTPLEAEGILTYRKKSLEMDRPSQEILKIRDGTPLEKRVALILVFKIRPSQEILKIRDGGGGRNFDIQIKIPRNGSVWNFSSKLDVPSNVVQKKRVARILVFKIRPSQEILKIRDGGGGRNFDIQKKIPRNGSVWNFSSKLDVPSNVVHKKRVARILVFKIRPSQEILKIRDGTPLEKKRVARILVFKIRPSQEILKIRDGTPLEAEGILTYRKKIPRNGSVWNFSNKLDVPSNVVQKKRVARILVFKIRPSQEILKIRDERKEFWHTEKSPRNGSVWHFSSKLDVPSNVVQKKRVALILVFKIRPSQEILKIRDGTPLEAEGILTYRKKIPRNGSVWNFSNKLYVPSNVVQKKRVARILVFKIRPSQEILKIRDGTPLEAERILTYRKKLSKWIEILKIRDGTPLEAEGILTYRKKIPRNGSVWHFSNKLDVPSNVLQKKRVARILVFKIRPSQEILKIRDGGGGRNFDIQKKNPSKWIVARILVFKIRPSQEILKIRDGTPLEMPSQEILKIRDGTPLEAEGILTYRKKIPRNGSVWNFSNKLDVPSNVVQKKRVARILKKRVARNLVFKIRPSQEILKIRDGTPLEAEGILTYRKKIPRNGSVWHFSNKLDVPSNVLQKKRVARILVFKIRPSQEILKIRDGGGGRNFDIQKKIPRNGSVWNFSNKLYVPSNVVQKKRVARILVFKIRPSQEILKIRDGTPLEAERILTYRKKLSKWIEPSQEILKIRDGTPLEKKRVARILVFKIRPSQEILKIRDGTSLEKKRVARILVFKIRPSQEILKIRDGTPLEAEGILTYRKKIPRNGSVWNFSNKLDVPSNVVQKKSVARILVFKIRPSQEILKIRDVALILVFKIRPSQEILKIRDGGGGRNFDIQIKIPRNGSVWNFSSKLDVPSNVVQKKRVARILVFKIRPSQEILKIRDGGGGTNFDIQKKNPSKWIVARILVFKIRPSQEILKIRDEILKIRDGTPLEAEGILTYRKKIPRNGSVWNFSNKVARNLVFKIRPSQEILKIRDGTPLEAEGILTYRKKIPRNGSVWHFSNKLDVPSNVLQKKRVARILVFKIRPSQEILKIRDGGGGRNFDIQKKIPRNGSVWNFSNKLYVPSNVVQKKRVARILVFKIRPSQEILKIRDGTPLEAERILTYRKKLSKWIVARILVFKIRPSQEILKIRDGTPLEAEGILTYRKKIPRNGSVWHFSNRLDVPSNVLQKKRVARILVFKIRPSQEILKIRDGTSLEKRVARILVFKIRPSQEILKIRDGTPLEAEGILTYRKKIPRNGSVWNFSNKLDVPSNVVQKKSVARILVFKIRPSQEILKIRDGTSLEKILKIRDGTPLEAEGILTYRKKSLEMDRPSQEILKIRDDILSNVVQKKRVALILVFKIRPSQEILKIRDGGGGRNFDIQIKIPRNGSVWNFSSKLDVPSNVVQKKRVARILVFKIRPSQEILKIRDGGGGRNFDIQKKIPRNGSVWNFSSKLDVPSNVVHKKRVARILVFKIRPSQEILKIRDGTPLEAEGILTYRKKIPRNGSVWNFSNKLDVPSNVLQKKRVARILVFKIRPSQEILKIRDGTSLEKRVARILVFKIRPSQEILKIRDGTPLEAEGILTYRKKISRNGSVWNFSNKLDVPSNVVQKKSVARILVFKIRPSQEILKIRDGTSLELVILVFKIRPSQEILKIRDGGGGRNFDIQIKIPRNGSVWNFSSKLDVPSNVVQKKRVARILVFKIRPSQEILKIRDGGGGTNFDIQKKNPSKWIEILKIRDVFKIRPSQEILKIRDGTPLEAEGILTYRKKIPRNGSIQKKRVARNLVFKIRPSQEILKIRDGTPLEAEGILTYRKKIPRNGSVWHFSNKLDVPSNVLQKKRVARILVFKIRPSQEILKIRDGGGGRNFDIQKKIPRNGSVWNFSNKLYVPSNVVQKKRVARILVFKIRPSQEILKIRDGTPLEAEGILTYRKKIPRNGSVWHFSNRLDVPSNVLQKKRVARILVFKIRPSQEILKIRDGTSLEAEGILTYRKKPSKWIGILTYRKKSLEMDRVARILVFKIRPSQEILKIRDGTSLEMPSQEILKIRDEILKIRDVQKKRVALILVFKIRPSQEILKIRDGGGGRNFDIQIKIPRNGSVWNFSSKLDVPSNVVQKKRVARILVFKIRPSQEILKIRDGGGGRNFDIQKKIPRNGSVWNFSSKLDVPSNVVHKKRVARILVFKIRPSQEILKIRDGTPLEAEGILTYRKKIPRNGSVWNFSNKLDVPSNVLQKKRVARILVFKIRPSQEILKIRDGTSLEKKRVARILVFKIRPSQEILKIRDGTPLEAEGILTYRKKISRNGSVWNFSNKLDVPSNVVQKKSVARILVFKIRPSQEILKIRDEILKIRDGGGGRNFDIQIKIPRNGSVWNFSSKLDVPSNVVQKKRVARILVFKIRPSQEILKIRDGGGGTNFDIQKKNPSKWIEILKIRDVARILVFKIRPSQEILKIRDGTPLEAEGILTYRKKIPRNGSIQKKRVARNLVFKIRPSQEILKIRDGTPLEAEGILTYRKKIPRNGSVWHFSNKLDVPSNVLQKKRVARILVFKIRPSQEILKIRDGGGGRNFDIQKKIPRNGSVWNFSNKLYVPSNVVQKKRVARILVFKIRPSQEILKIRDGTPLEAEGILTYRKKIPRNGSVWHFSNRLDVPSNVLQKKRVARILVFKIRPSQEILKIRDGTSLEAEGILTYRKKPSKWIVFKIRPSQEILKIRDGTPLEAEGILTYRKKIPRNGSVWNFSNKLDVPSNVVQKKSVARILVFKIRPSQEILKIRDGTSLEAEGILTYRKKPSKWIEILKIRDEPSQEILKIRDVALILVFKIRPSQEILKIRDGGGGRNFDIQIKIPRNGSVWNFSSKLDVPSNVVQKKRVARILVFKIRPSQEILKIRDGGGGRNFDIQKKIPRNGSVWNFSSKLDVPSNVVHKKRVARILVFKIRPSQEILKIRDGTPLEMPSQEILKIRDGTPLEAEGILTYRKKIPRNGSVWNFSNKLDVPSNVVQKKRVMPSQEILKIRDGTPLEAEGILTYRKKIPRNGSVWNFSNKLDVPSNVLQKKRVARILVFKIRPSQEILKIRDGTSLEMPSQEILKIRDGTPLEAEGILTYRKKISRNGSVWNFSNKLDVPSNVVQKKSVARILVFKIRPSQEILKIRDVALILVFKIRPSQEILKIRDGGGGRNFDIQIKIPRNGSVWNFSSKLDVPSNVVQKKRVARILVFKIRPSQEILKIRDGGGGTNFDIQKKNPSKWIVARILVFKIRPSQEILKIRDEILKIRDGTPLEAEGILTYRKKIPRNGSIQKKRVARNLVFKIRPSQEILKIRDGTPLEAEGILTYRKKIPRNGSVWHFSNKLDVPSNVLQKKRVARILVFKIRPSQEILKIRDGGGGRNFDIQKKIPRNGSVWNFSNKLYVPSNVVQKKRVARILVFKIRPSQEILKIRDGTPLEAEGILTYRKKIPRNGSVWHFSNRLDVPSNVLQKKRVARILVFKIRPSQEILKIRDGTSLEKRVARILVFKIRPSQEILKIRDGTPLEAEGILTYRKKIPRNGSVWNFSNKLDVPSNVVQKKSVARILVFKIRPSQEILKIRDGTSLEAEGILTYRKKPSKWIEILKIRDGTPLEAEGILTYRKKSLEMDRVARILVFKIRPSQEILKIRDVALILVFKIRPSQEILKIRDGGGGRNFDIQIKIPRNGSVWNFSSKLDVPSNVVQKKRVARILVFKIRPSQEILKIRDGGGGTNFDIQKKNPSKWIVARILVFKIRPSQEILKIRDVFKIRPSQEILKIRDGTPLEAEGILTYRKKIPRNGSVWNFSNKLDVPSNVVQKKRVLDVPSNVVQKKRVARNLVFKIRPSQEILKIRDGTPLEAEGILTYRKKIPRNGSVWHFSNKLDVPSNVLQKKRVARILVFKIRPSQEILKIRDGGGGRNFDIQKKIPRNGSVWNFSNKLYVPSNVVQKKRVARILVFKIRPSQEILKIRDGTPLEAEGILTYRKKIPRNGSVWHFSNRLDVPSNVLQKKRVARILVFKIRPSQEILKIRDGTSLEAEGILTYRKKPSKWIVFKIRPSQEILKIRDGTPLEAEGILTYRKKIPRNGSVWNFSNKLDVPSNVVQKKSVARILVFKIRPSQEILKIRDGTSLEKILKIRDGTPLEMPSQEILKIRDGGGGRNFDIQIKIPRNGSVWNFSSKLDVPSNVVQKKRVARILVFKIRPSQEILKIRDGGGGRNFDIQKKIPRNGSVWNFSSKLDVPSNVVHKKRVARILVFKIRPSQEILKIRDGTPLEAERILTYRKKPSKWIVFKIRPSQEILKIRDGTPLEAEGILTYRKKIPRNGSVWNFSNKLDVPSNVVQKKRVARILVFKIRPSQEILKIRDGTSLEAEGILT
ncbi:hypothetical protein OROHE_018381 [Orobanche hederae]